MFENGKVEGEPGNGIPSEVLSRFTSYTGRQFMFLRQDVERYNAQNHSSLDPIAVALALKERGCYILSIPVPQLVKKTEPSSGPRMVAPPQTLAPSLKRTTEAHPTQNIRGRDERYMAELRTSRQAAERFLFGVSRSELERTANGVDTGQAARVLKSHAKAKELVALHAFDPFDYVYARLATEAEDTKTHSTQAIKDRRLAFATILKAFGKPRTLEEEFPGAKKEDPHGYLLSTIQFWSGALFTEELPPQTYQEVMAAERKHLLKSNLDPADLEKKMKPYAENLDMAVAWWPISVGRKFKMLKPHIAETMQWLQKHSPNFNGDKFYHYLGQLMREYRADIQTEERKKKNRASDTEFNPVRLRQLESDLAFIKTIQAEFHLHFIMSLAERAQEIERRMREQGKK